MQLRRLHRQLNKILFYELRQRRLPRERGSWISGTNASSASNPIQRYSKVQNTNINATASASFIRKATKDQRLFKFETKFFVIQFDYTMCCRSLLNCRSSSHHRLSETSCIRPRSWWRTAAENFEVGLKHALKAEDEAIVVKSAEGHLEKLLRWHCFHRKLEIQSIFLFSRKFA